MAESGNWKPKEADLQEFYGLTPRQAQVALCLSEGLSYAEIAECLGVSFHTACSHVKAILLKTGAGSSRKLAAMVIRGEPAAYSNY
jgi:DNA-binding CsgD family transcriptional regulator